MIKSNKLIEKVNKVLADNYPIKKSFENISELSHFHFIHIVKYDYKLPFNIDMKNLYNNKIAKVFTTKYMSWRNYVELYLFFINYSSLFNDRLIFYINRESKIDILHINSVIMKDGTKIDIIYEFNKYNYIQKSIQKINKDNHFYFSSFNIISNKEEIRTELLRLFSNRDNYKNIHFHLDNNGGGDNVPAHLILRCLTGKKEKWMKNIKKILKDKTILEWNCWNEDKIGSYNYDAVEALDLGTIPIYTNKYKGKIHLHMNTNNGSASWYFITYLIYSFGSEIKRYTVKNIKFGTISKNSQLVLYGTSNTTSGDGNTIQIPYKDIIISCPTEQFISCSIKEKDWWRFWTE